MGEAVADGYERKVWRVSAGVSAALAAVALPTGFVMRGWPGLWGASIGAAIVVIFLAIHLLVSVLTRNLDPISTMAMAMFAYFAKVLALGGFLVAFRGSSFLDRTTFAITAICITAGWLAAEIRTYITTRFVLMDGQPSAGEGEHGQDS